MTTNYIRVSPTLNSLTAMRVCEHQCKKLTFLHLSCMELLAHIRKYSIFQISGDTGSNACLPLDGEPTIFVQYYNHLPNARRVSSIEDIRWGEGISLQPLPIIYKKEDWRKVE